MKTCPPCNQDCNQSDTCPRRTGSPSEPPANTTTKLPPPWAQDVDNPEDPDNGGAWAEIVFWGSNLVYAFGVTAITFVVAGYAYVRFGG